MQADPTSTTPSERGGGAGVGFAGDDACGGPRIATTDNFDRQLRQTRSRIRTDSTPAVSHTVTGHDELSETTAARPASAHITTTS